MLDQQTEGSTAKNEERQGLNCLNWLNPVFYLCNVVFTYGVGVLGWIGKANNEISEKYQPPQAIVTPRSTAFAIWSVIFVFQAIFVLLQLLPQYRGKVIVQKGVGYWYISTCITQALWTYAFAYEHLAVSLFLIILVWLSLVGLVASQYHTKSEASLVEFWLFRFPFSIHCGWLTAASALNVSLLLVGKNAPAASQLAVGIISLSYLFAVSMWVLFGIQRADYTIAAVLAWANAWIYVELQEPKDSIVARFCPDIVSGVSYAAAAVTVLILAQIVVRILMSCAKKLQCIPTKKGESTGSQSGQVAATKEFDEVP